MRRLATPIFDNAHHGKIQRNLMIEFQENTGQMSGGKDGQNLFGRILLAIADGLTSTTAVDWHIKVKDKKCDIGLTKNYCITISMKKINSIHKLIQQILVSHELSPMNRLTTPIFDHTHSKIF